MNDELKHIWMEAVAAYSRYYPRISQGSRCHGRVSNRVRTEYKSRPSPLHQEVLLFDRNVAILSRVIASAQI
jgi:hypothetical protein